MDSFQKLLNFNSFNPNWNQKWRGHQHSESYFEMMTPTTQRNSALQALVEIVTIKLKEISESKAWEKSEHCSVILQQKTKGVKTYREVPFSDTPQSCDQILKIFFNYRHQTLQVTIATQIIHQFRINSGHSVKTSITQSIPLNMSDIWWFNRIVGCFGFSLWNWYNRNSQKTTTLPWRRFEWISLGYAWRQERNIGTYFNLSISSYHSALFL